MGKDSVHKCTNTDTDTGLPKLLGGGDKEFGEMLGDPVKKRRRQVGLITIILTLLNSKI